MRLGKRTLTYVLLLGSAFAAQSAGAEGGRAPVYKDTERFAEPGFRPQSYESLPQVTVGALRPATRHTGDSDYSGSAYGLGKPSFNGVGSRPDWGRSNP